MSETKGLITMRYWVTCGRCGFETPLGTSRPITCQLDLDEDALHAAHCQGWVRTIKHGWLCVACQPERWNMAPDLWPLSFQSNA